MLNPKAIIFDMDDTLYPEEQYVLSGFRAVANWAEDVLGICREQGFQQLQEMFNRGERGNTFNLFCAENKLDEAGLIKQMIQVYREHDPELTPFPEVLEVLTSLAAHFLLGIITDGYLTVQQKKLAALNLPVSFEAIIFSDKWGRENWKPSHRPFNEALRLCKTTAAETIYIGDNPAKDFIGARQLGIRTVMVRRAGSVYEAVVPPTPEHTADYNVTNLKQLLEIVALE